MDVIGPEIIKQRNQQSNYETIIQIISLRALPENISEPKIIKTKLNEWGKSDNGSTNCWEFQFEILQNAVFNDGNNELGNLYKDCVGVPMIVGLSEYDGLEPTLGNDNIYFEIIQK